MAGGGPRWSDRVAIGALTQTYPPALVDEVLAQTGRREQRTRLLPARMVVYYCWRWRCLPTWPTWRCCGC
jgi:hypothetical protein